MGDGAKPIIASTGLWGEVGEVDCDAMQTSIDRIYNTQLLNRQSSYRTAVLDKVMNSQIGSVDLQSVAESDPTRPNGRVNKEIKIIIKDRKLCLDFYNKAIECGDKDVIKEYIRTGQIKITLKEDDIVLCKNGKEWTPLVYKAHELINDCHNGNMLASDLAQVLQAIDEYVNKLMIKSLYELAGPTAQGEDCKTVPLNVPASAAHPLGLPIPAALSKIERCIDDANLSGVQHCLIHGYDFKDYFNTRMPNCVPFQFPDGTFTFDAVFDREFNQLMGSEYAMAVANGSLQIVNFPYFVGENAYDYPTKKAFVLTTPMGIAVNFTWEHTVDGKCNEICLRPFFNFSLYPMPVFGCDSDGTNGITLIKNCVSLDFECPADYVPPTINKVCPYLVFPYTEGTAITVNGVDVTPTLTTTMTPIQIAEALATAGLTNAVGAYVDGTGFNIGFVAPEGQGVLIDGVKQEPCAPCYTLLPGE